jgi:hypothetical protein
MHMLGRAISTEIWRNGERISFVEENDYSFNRQNAYHFDKPLEINKYDKLKIVCYFNTMSKTNITYGGESSSEEMCYTWI